MDRESIRQYCLSFPHTTEVVQWEDHLLLKVAGRMFLVMSLEPDRVALSFQATPEAFYELQEIEGVIPAPYMARRQWLALERFDTLRDDELRELIATSYRLIFAKLPKKTQAELQAGKPFTPTRAKSAKKRIAAKRTSKSPAKKLVKKRVAK